MFSGKQKKKQLQEKRLRKLVGGTHLQRLAAAAEASTSAPTVVAEGGGGGGGGVPTDVSTSLGRSSKNNRWSTVFAKEDSGAVQARRLRASVRLNVSGRGLPLCASPPSAAPDPALAHPRGLLSTLGGEVGAAGREAYQQAGARAAEEAAFAAWLSAIYVRYSRSQLNQFEHNVEVWMQLWHSLATAHVVCIVTDVRNPLWHLPPSLVQQVQQDLKKPLVIVLNKVDLVPAAAVAAWRAWLQEHIPGAIVVPFTSSGAQLANDLTLAARRRALHSARVTFDAPHTERRVASVRALMQAVGAPAEAVDEVVARVAATRREGDKRADAVLTGDVMDALYARKVTGGGGGRGGGGGGSGSTEEEEEEAEELEQEELGASRGGSKAKLQLGHKHHSHRRKGRKGRKHGAREEAEERGEFEHPWQGRQRHFKRGDAGARLVEMLGSFSAARKAKEEEEQQEQEEGGGSAGESHTGELEGVVEEEGEEEEGAEEGEEGEGQGEGASQEEQEEAGSAAMLAVEAASGDAQKHVPAAAAAVIVAMVGHPNVGKSSVINALCCDKRVSVSRTAGHTKRAQTIPLATGICLIDSPGLVFPHSLGQQGPSPVAAAAAAGGGGAPESPEAAQERALQECLGVVPLAQVREPYTAVRLLGEHLEVERLYGLTPRRDELEDMIEAEGWDAHEAGRGGKPTKGAALASAAQRYVWNPLTLCEALAEKRGYYIAKTGRLDSHAAGREILFDAQDGILPLHFLPPAAAAPAPSAGK